MFRDRIVLLESKVAAEEQQRDEERYRQAIAGLEGSLAKRARAAAEVERLTEQLATALKKFAASDRAVLKAWDSNVEWPVRVYPGGRLGTAWIGSRFGDQLGPNFIDRIRRRAPDGDEWFSLLSRLDISGAGENAAEQGRELADSLRHAHDPRPVEEDPNPRTMRLIFKLTKVIWGL